MNARLERGQKMFLEREDVLFTDMGGGITRRALGRGDNIMGAIMTFQKGSYVDPHSHEDHEQFIFVLSGKFELTCGTVKKIVTAGGCCYAKKNEIHGTLSLEDGSSLLDMHTPLRLDILEDPAACVDTISKLGYDGK